MVWVIAFGELFFGDLWCVVWGYGGMRTHFSLLNPLMGWRWTGACWCGARWWGDASVVPAGVGDTGEGRSCSELSARKVEAL